MRNRRRVASLALAVAAALLFWTQTSPAAEQTFKWRMTTSWATGIPLYTEMAELFAKKVDALSGGRLKLQVLPGGTIAPALEVTDAVAKGICEIGHLWPGYDIGRDATTAILGGWAGGMESVPMMHWLYTGGGVELWKEFRLAKFGVIGIPCGIRPTELFLHSHKAIRTLADLKGTKIRTVGAWAEILPKLGASVVTLPGNEVFPALERKVIDATEWATPGENVISGFHEVARYVIIPGAHQPSAPFEIVINKGKWDGLPKDLQVIVEQSAMLVTFESWVRIGKLDMGAMDVFKKKGNEIIVLDSETQTACLKLGKEWAQEKASKNEWFKKVLDSMNTFESGWDNVAPTRYFEYKK
jgi:TRAP-type mannitol/chloroaromatic compound transport system substrate-binding protein